MGRDIAIYLNIRRPTLFAANIVNKILYILYFMKPFGIGTFLWLWTNFIIIITTEEEKIYIRRSFNFNRLPYTFIVKLPPRGQRANFQFKFLVILSIINIKQNLNLDHLARNFSFYIKIIKTNRDDDDNKTV